MDDIIKYVPVKWRGTLLVILAISPYVTRAYHALSNGGGLKGVWAGIWFGTNTPKTNGNPNPTPKITALGIFALFFGGIALFLQGCASLAPGADAFVVTVERGETVANATFDMVLNEDNSNRPFWRTNAPAFHTFCEWLRTPITYRGNTQARCVVMQLNLEDLKVAFKAAKTADSSNALWTAWGTLNVALSQAQSWENIVTNPVPK